MTVVRRLVLSMLMLAFTPVSALAGSPPAVTAGDRFIGRADAPVTVVEYASFACSHCADWHLVVYPEFKRRFIDTGQVRLVFRNLPTAPTEIALPAAALARCAAPERFYDVAGALMQGQRAVLYGGDRGTWYDNGVAVSGRTRAQIDACVALPATRAAIEADIDGAVAAGVDSTPTLFVNGRQVADRSMGGLAAMITPLVAAH
ncbi:MAG: protein-disulfide isomerase [Brevundimonas sp.]|uniref:thioredoxin domain-containing protein n=1 Tax=Brevundimonas sp. TaxID=1871086 RepID=UPI0039E42B67